MQEQIDRVIEQCEGNDHIGGRTAEERLAYADEVQEGCIGGERQHRGDHQLCRAGHDGKQDLYGQLGQACLEVKKTSI